MKGTLRLFLFFLLCAFLAGVVLHSLVARLLHTDRVFGALPRMFTYHDQHPYQYVLVVAVCFALTATIHARKRLPVTGWKRFGEIMAVLAISVITASVPGGVLWKIHDMQAGYFPQGLKFFGDLADGAMMGLQLGWLIVALSFPLNLCCAAVAYWIMLLGMRFDARRKAVSQAGFR